MAVKYLVKQQLADTGMAEGSSKPEKSSRSRPRKTSLEIYLLRHGEAGARFDEPEKDDARPLTREGRTEMAEIAKSLPKLGVEFDLIASSPLPRALQTAEIVARQYRMLNNLEKWDELHHPAETESLFRRLSRQKKGSSVFLVGHEPHLSGMIGEIISGTSGVNLVLKKAGLAKVEILAFKPKITGELRWLLTPKIVKKTGK
jgi:phosphohistidine phosphatase